MGILSAISQIETAVRATGGGILTGQLFSTAITGDVADLAGTLPGVENSFSDGWTPPEGGIPSEGIVPDSVNGTAGVISSVFGGLLLLVVIYVVGQLFTFQFNFGDNTA